MDGQDLQDGNEMSCQLSVASKDNPNFSTGNWQLTTGNLFPARHRQSAIFRLVPHSRRRRSSCRESVRGGRAKSDRRAIEAAGMRAGQAGT